MIFVLACISNSSVCMQVNTKPQVYPGSPLAYSSPSKTNNRRSVDKLRFLEVNFQSTFDKRKEFWCVLDAVKPDVIFGCKTWLKPAKSNGEIFPPGHEYMTFTALIERMATEESCLLFTAALTVIKLVLKLGLSYWLPRSSMESKQLSWHPFIGQPTTMLSMENLTNSLKHLCQSNPGGAIWCSGDINLPDIDWETLSICSYQYLKAINESFLDLLDIAGLEQMVDFPTREENTLDVFVTNRPSLTSKCCPLPALSDPHHGLHGS